MATKKKTKGSPFYYFSNFGMYLMIFLIILIFFAIFSLAGIGAFFVWLRDESPRILVTYLLNVVLGNIL